MPALPSWKMYRILVHLGLPKTATTSLQHNVFQPLHDQGRINFLGKNLDYNETNGNVVVINYNGKFIREAAEGKLCVEKAKGMLSTVLTNEKLNVFSDEGLMIAYPGQKNLSLNQKFSNLKQLFDGYDAKVVLTLRDPVEYCYSLYVQMYPDFFSTIADLNSFEKYSDKIFQNENDVMFESFFSEKYLSKLEREFDVSLTYFEDLSRDKLRFYNQWAEFLSVDSEVFSQLFESKHENQKVKKATGSQKVFSLKPVETFGKEAFSQVPWAFPFFRYLYRSFNLRSAFNKRVSLGSVHNKPVGERLARLNDVFHGYSYRNRDSKKRPVETAQAN